MSKVTVLYIAGIGRNGGTLVDRILGATPGFTSLGEVYFLWKKGLRDNELCNCGQPLRECEFWRGLLADTFEGADIPDGTRMMELVERVDRTRWIPSLVSPMRPPGFSAALREYKDVLRRLYFALHEHTGGDILVNSSKFASHAIILSQIPGIEVKVLHLVRDSRAAAFSWMKKVRLAERVGTEAYLKRYSPTSSSMQWLYRNMASHLLKRHAGQFMRMRYEEFAAQPSANMRHVVDWAGAPAAQLPFVEDNVVSLESGHTQSGNPMRFNTGPVTITPDLSWHDELPGGSRKLVTALTWPLLLAYGYEI